MADQGDRPLSAGDKDRHVQGWAATNHNDEASTVPSSDVERSTTKMHPQKTSTNLSGTRTRLGLHPTAPVAEEHDIAEHSDLLWPKIRIAMKEPFAEFWGTFFLVLFGDGSVAQVLLSTNQKTAPGGDGFGAYQSINWGVRIPAMRFFLCLKQWLTLLRSNISGESVLCLEYISLATAEHSSSEPVESTQAAKCVD